MNKKIAIVIILLPLVAWFALSLLNWPFHLELIYMLLPLFAGLFMLIKFGKNSISRCVSLLSLNPLLSIPFSFLRRQLSLPDKFLNTLSSEIVGTIFLIVPELIFTAVIVYVFRYLFKKDRAVWLFLIIYIIRWLSVFIVSLFPTPYPELYFDWQFYAFIFFVFIFPSMYAIAGLVAIKGWVNKYDTAN